MAMHVMLPRGAAWDTNGVPDPGATLTVYQSETSTLASIYSDPDLTVELDNPMEANSRGVFPRAYIAAGTYKAKLTYSDGTVETYDLTETGVSNISSAVPSILGWQAGDSKALARSKLECASSTELATLQYNVSSLQNTVSEFPEFGDLAAEDVVTSEFASTGMIVGRAYGEYTANSDLSAAIPSDDSKPQIGEGTEIISVSYTPQSATNKLCFRFRGSCAPSTGTVSGAALFKNSDADCLVAESVHHGANETRTLAFEYEEVAGTTSPTTFSVRAGPASGTLRFNGTASARRYGGASRATLVIEEIKV